MPAPRRPAPKAIPPPGIGLADHAYNLVRDRILRGELPLGTPLSRRQLAADLHMSILPVAEALNRLENDGFIESRPRVGTRVCSPTPEDVLEQCEVREALECQSARLFAANATPEQKRELSDMASQLDEMFNQSAVGGNDPETLYRVRSFHVQFHLRIADCTGCKALRQMLEKNQVLLFTWLFDIAAQRPPLPPRHHRDLIRAISKGTPQEADRAMRHHVRKGVGAITRALLQRSRGSDTVTAKIAMRPRTMQRPV